MEDVGNPAGFFDHRVIPWSTHGVFLPPKGGGERIKNGMAQWEILISYLIRFQQQLTCVCGQVSYKIPENTQVKQ